MTRRADRLPLRWLACAVCCLPLHPPIHAAPARPLGDDYAGVPPARELGRRGIASNVVGCSIHGDSSRPDPPRALIDAVARGDVDVAIAWGPLAGYFAGRAPVPLVVTTIEAVPDRAGEDPLRFSIAAGVRHGDDVPKHALQAALDRRREEVQQLLAA